MLSQKVRNIFRWEERVGRSAFDLPTFVLSHLDQRFVGENYTKLIIDNDHSLVELFKDTLHLTKPIRSLEIDVRHSIAQLNSSAKTVYRSRNPAGDWRWRVCRIESFQYFLHSLCTN